MVTNKTAKGFTLIELMLATSLLMLIMFSGYYAYSLYTQKWQKRVQVFWQGTEQSIALNTLNRMLTSINSYVVKGKGDKACVYFFGTDNTMRFVTDFPIYSKSTAIVELEVREENGAYQLIYKEKNLENSVLLSLDEMFDENIWQKKTVLLSNLHDIQWTYYGWNSFDSALTQSNITGAYNNQDTRQWYSLHDANEIRILPINIQFNIVFKELNQVSEWLITLPNNTIYKLIADLRVDA